MRRSIVRIQGDCKPESKSNIMDPIKLHIRSSSRSNLFTRNSAKHATKSKLLISAACALVLALLFCYLFLSTKNVWSSEKRKYGIVIDGGSTGTRIHVFGYKVEGNNAVFDFGKEGLASMRLNPGLSANADNPDEAGSSIGELLDFAKGRIPKNQWGSTEIQLMATAGLRMLEPSVQEQILESCRQVLRSSGFKFQDDWARVISGSDEGIFAWVVANYALGTLGGDPQETTGIIELGGASAQVTFVSSEPIPAEFSHTITFRNITYNLYSHSFLHFGQNAAHDSLREALLSRDFNLVTRSLREGMLIDPCAPKGYSQSIQSWNMSPDSLSVGREYLTTVQSKGNFSECRSAALEMLQKGKEKCSYQQCNIGSTFIPKLRGKFLATENFFYTSKFFHLDSRAFLSDLMTAGEQFCGEDWSQLKKRYKTLSEEDLLRYCFSSAYIVALLHDGLGIALDDQSILVANNVEKIPLDWALGAFISQSMKAIAGENSGWIANIISYESPTLLSVIAISMLLLFIAWSISKWKKPELKTIYDLEKGRYIVTRVNRF